MTCLQYVQTDSKIQMSLWDQCIVSDLVGSKQNHNYLPSTTAMLHERLKCFGFIKSLEHLVQGKRAASIDIHRCTQLG